MSDVIQKAISGNPVRADDISVFISLRKSNAVRTNTSTYADANTAASGNVSHVSTNGETDLTAVQNKYQIRLDDPQYYSN